MVGRFAGVVCVIVGSFWLRYFRVFFALQIGCDARLMVEFDCDSCGRAWLMDVQMFGFTSYCC